MTLKGNYAAGTSYNVDDVVRGTDRWYVLKKAASAGTPVTDTLYWQAKDPNDTDLLDLMQSILDKVEAVNPDAKTLVLASSSDASVKKMAITVVDNGTISASEVS